MNISYDLLRRYVATDLTPDEVATALTSIGLEVGGVEEVESIPGGLKGLVIGRVLTCEAHANSDHLHVTTVDIGCLLYTSPSPRDTERSRMPSSA